MAESKISMDFFTKEFSAPAISYVEGPVGTYCGYKDIDISKIGYKPISVMVTSMNHPSEYWVIPMIPDDATLKIRFFRSTAVAINEVAGNSKFLVTYRKS